MPYTIVETCNGCGACKRICPTEAISGEKKSIHNIDSGLCIECGACGRVCPNEAVMDGSGKKCIMIKRSQWKRPVFDQKTCMSCNICIDACPKTCLALAEPAGRKNLHGLPYLKEEKACIGCGFCAQECPVDSINMSVPPAKESKTTSNTDEQAA